MSEGKWTKGPFHTLKGDSVVGIVTASGDLIAKTATKAYWQKFDATDEANAHLLASAPDLYDALFALMNMVAISKFEVEDGEPPMLKDGIYDRNMRKAQLALARARGENP